MPRAPRKAIQFLLALLAPLPSWRNRCVLIREDSRQFVRFVALPFPHFFVWKFTRISEPARDWWMAGLDPPSLAWPFRNSSTRRIVLPLPRHTWDTSRWVQPS